MIALLADEDFNWHIVRGLLRCIPNLDLVALSDMTLIGKPDSVIIYWAGENGRILLTHDVNTITEAAFDRVRAGLLMPGVICVPQRMGIGLAIKDLFLMASCMEPQEIENQVWYLPL